MPPRWPSSVLLPPASPGSRHRRAERRRPGVPARLGPGPRPIHLPGRPVHHLRRQRRRVGHHRPARRTRDPFALAGGLLIAAPCSGCAGHCMRRPLMSGPRHVLARTRRADRRGRSVHTCRDRHRLHRRSRPAGRVSRRRWPGCDARGCAPAPPAGASTATRPTRPATRSSSRSLPGRTTSSSTTTGSPLTTMASSSVVESAAGRDAGPAPHPPADRRRPAARRPELT